MEIFQNEHQRASSGTFSESSWERLSEGTPEGFPEETFWLFQEKCPLDLNHWKKLVSEYYKKILLSI